MILRSSLLYGLSWGVMLWLGWTVGSRSMCAIASAQETQGSWEVTPILIPADPELQRQYIPRSYIPIEIEDLEAKLREEQVRRREEQFLKSVLTDAFYVARIDNGLLVADQVRWRFRGGPGTKPLNLGTVSVALRDARSMDANRLDQLSTYQSFLPDGSLELRIDEPQADRWLGLTATAVTDEAGEVYSLRLPVATVANMLVSSRGNERIASDEVVVEEVERPADYFPQDWPRGSVRDAALSGSRRWWLVNISGQQEFRLKVERTIEDDHLVYQHSVRLAELDYLIGPQQMDIRAVWQLAATSLGAPLHIRLGDSLRIKSLFLNGVAVEWKSRASQLAGENWIEIVDQPLLEPGSVLQLTAVAEHQPSGAFRLPAAHVARSWCIEGVTRVRGTPGVNIDSVEYEGGICISDILGSTGNSQGEVAWSHAWSGVLPELKARIASVQTQLEVDALNRINVQAAWISANSRLRLTSSQLRSNELRLRVDPHWFIDSVQLLDETEVDYRAQLLEDNSNGELRSEIVISWEQERSSIELELEVMAHRPRDDSQDSVLLQYPQVVAIEGSDATDTSQTDTYVVESSGRFRVQPTASLLRFQRLARQLPAWQQALLPQLTDAWIFTDRYGTMPTIRLAATGGTYTIDLYTLVAENEAAENEASLVYRVTCRPVSGSVDRLRVRVPASVSPENLSFELLEPLDANVVPLGIEEVESADDYRELHVYFPTARTSPCRVRGRLKNVVGNATTQVITLAFPDATTIQSTLLLPEERAAFAGKPKLELLPASACCSAEEAWLFEEELKGAAPDEFAAARLDGTETMTIELRPPRERLAPGWIWSSVIDRYRWDDCSSKFVVQWDIETTGSSDFSFLLPSHWRLDRIEANGESADDALLMTPRHDLEHPPVVDESAYSAVHFRLSLPPNRRTKVELECSVDPQPGLTPVVDQLALEEPLVIDMPIFDSDYRLHLAPSSVALSINPRVAAGGGGRLIDRLWPTAWWSMLAPHANHVQDDSTLANVSASGDPNGWNVVDWPAGPAVASVDLTENHRVMAQSVWVMRRSALAACLTSLLLVLTALFWGMFSLSPRGWWWLTALTLMTCILLPREWVSWAQFLLLASGLSVVVRLVTWIALTRFSASKLQEASGSLRRSSMTELGGCLLIVLALPATAALAQAPRTSTSSPATSLADGIAAGREAALGQSTDDKSSSATELYGVLFPVDEQSQIDGAYAYVPTRLWELLSVGNSNELSEEAPRILSAAYLLRLRPGSVNAELSVDLRIQATQQGGELRLPFRAEELQLRGGQINGEERLVGLPGLLQEPGFVSLRASKEGTFPVTLQFVTVNTDESMRLKAALPPVPNATLRIESEGLQVDVHAIGGVQSTGTGEIVANLGPVNELDVSWRESSPRGFSTQGELASETWVHAGGEQLVAACQLKFTASNALRPLLHVYIDSDWEPVGTSWGDAELLPNETMSFGNRRVYTVRMRSRPYLASKVDVRRSEDKSAAVIRVLLVPANPSTANAINVPLLALQEQSASSRRLSWSTSSEGSSWKADGIDFLQESFDEGSDWGELALAPQRRNFTVPFGAAPLQLRRQNAVLPPAVEERTVLHYSLAEIAVEYGASWESRGPVGALRLLIPKQSRIVSLTVNDQPINYRVSSHDEGQWLLIPGKSFRASSSNALELRFSLPAQLGQSTEIPRVALRGIGVASSRLVVYRGTRLDFQFDEPTAAELLRREISTPSSLLLDSLEVMVGEFELGGYSATDEPRTQFTATVRESLGVEPEYAMLLLTPTNDGWMANVVAVWRPLDSLDFAFFDVPSSTRNTLQAGSVARKFMPAADSSRATLCIVPNTTATGQRIVRFSFPISNASSGQTLAVPRVQLLGEAPRPLWLALPRRLDGTAIRWTKTANRVDPDLVEHITEPGIDNFEIFASTPSRTQIAWEAITAEATRPLVVQKMVRVLKVDKHRTTAVLSFWLLPRGELEVEVGVPAGCGVLGVDIGGTSAIWRRTSPHRVSVSTKPNYLPVNLQMLVEWSHGGDGEIGELELPMPLAELSSDEWLVSMGEKSRWRLGAPRGQTVLLKAGANAIWSAWFELVWGTMQTQTAQSNEIALWMTHWEPRQLGVAYEHVLDQSAIAKTDAAWDADNDGMITAAEFWVGSGGVLTPDGPQQAVVPSTNEQLYVLTQNRLAFTSTTLSESMTPRIAAAFLLALAAFLGMVVFNRVRNQYLGLLATQPWLLWMKLGLLILILLPVVWPGVLVLAMAAILVVSQAVSQRARSRRGLV